MTHSRKSALLLCALLMTSCSVGPDYKRPDVTTPDAYKEIGKWDKAQPADDTPRGEWWTIYKDTTLNDLEKQVAVSNQNLKASEAAYRQALAAVQEARSAYFPTLDADTSATHTKRSSGSNVGVVNSGTGPVVTGGSNRSNNQYNADLSADWEIDLWGRIGRTVQNEKDLAQASAADLASATLSLQSTLAIDYFELSAVDQLKKLLDDTVKADSRSLQIAQNQYKVGIVSKADVVQAQSQVDAVRSQAINIGIQRAQLEHAIAVLIGKAPAELTLAETKDLPEPPVVPVGVPSTLLQRRPDIAVAERQVAAANEQIGIAESAYYPDLTLSATGGLAGSTFGNLFKTSNFVWSVGPDLGLTLFDGGARSAQVKEAQAGYDQQVALYRQAVLTAFQQVEDNLSAVTILEQQAKVQADVVASAAEASRIIQNQYNAGTVVFTDVVTVQNTELAQRQTALTIRQNRLTSSVQLVTALGGGWDGNLTPDPAPAEKK
jgi:NodT family efflux transporter outer membrane factor (OMF) lipoprotein